LGATAFKPAPFGRYILLAPIAEGGMGQIFLAKTRGAEGFEKLCVIKKILPAFAKDPEFVGRFVDEAKILVKLTHGSIAQVFDMGMVDDDYYIALEFVDGKDLRHVVVRQRDVAQRFPPALAGYILTRVLDALAYAHRKKNEQEEPLVLVHRDISPQNILLSYEGEVKVIDFGLAKVAKGARRTSPSVVMGKFYYMAPEQATHIDVDRRVDLYAAGMVLYELLAGSHPLEGTPAHQVFERLSKPNLPPLGEHAPHVPPALCEVVDKALRFSPDERYASAEEFRGKLQAVQLQLDPGCGPEALSKYLHEAFTAEYARERAIIAGLSSARIQPADDTAQHTHSFLNSPIPDRTSQPAPRDTVTDTQSTTVEVSESLLREAVGFRGFQDSVKLRWVRDRRVMAIGIGCLLAGLALSQLIKRHGQPLQVTPAAAEPDLRAQPEPPQPATPPKPTLSYGSVKGENVKPALPKPRGMSADGERLWRDFRTLERDFASLTPAERQRLGPELAQWDTVRNLFGEQIGDPSQHRELRTHLETYRRVLDRARRGGR
jgi:serine/threonine protein kinase